MGVFDWLYNSLGVVLAFFYGMVPSYAFAIAMLTITVRVVLIPLTAKQVKSQRAMQQLSPELKRLQAKYKGDRQRLNEEMMKLYKEQKANPLAGCLPLILQLPVFIVLYRLIIDLSKVPPKHIPSGSELFTALVESGGRLQSLGMNLAERPQNVVGLILVAAVVASGYFQQKQMTARMSSDAINPQMQMITKVFPVFFGVISLSVPAGVVVYFLISNLWQMGQQEVAFRHQPELPTPTETSAKESKPTKGGQPEVSRSGGSSAKGGGTKGAGTKGAGTKGAGTKGAGTKGAGTKGATARSGQEGGSRGGGRPTSGRVTPKGGPKASGRVTPKGGPDRGRGPAGGRAGDGRSGRRGGTAEEQPTKPARTAAVPASGGDLGGTEHGDDGEQAATGGLGRLSRMLSPRRPSPRRPPPIPRPKGLPPARPGGGAKKGW